jgi:proline iminopeptidase
VPLTESPGEGRLVDVGDTRLFVVERSVEGLPLICLHGGPGFDHWSFGDYLDPLAVDLRLILVDQRGQGMSDAAPPESLTVAEMADDVVRLAEALELDEFAVLGHSFGGFVALRLAVDRPGGVKALVLVSTAAAADSVEAAPDLARALDLDTATDEQMRRAVESCAPAWFGDPEDPQVGVWLRKMAPAVFRPNVLAAFQGRGVDPGIADRLDEVAVPALVVGGRRDQGTIEASEALARAIPGAELVVLERSGHLPFVEEQEPFLEAVRSFLRDVR